MRRAVSNGWRVDTVARSLVEMLKWNEEKRGCWEVEVNSQEGQQVVPSLASHIETKKGCVGMSERESGLLTWGKGFPKGGKEVKGRETQGEQMTREG